MRLVIIMIVVLVVYRLSELNQFIGMMIYCYHFRLN